MQEIVEIVKEAQRRSIIIIGKLFISLGLNPKEYKKIFKDIKFDKTDENEVGYFSVPEDKIILTTKFIKIIRKSLKEAKDKERIKELIIDEITETLTHETIHACRVITSKDKVSLPYIMHASLSRFNNTEIELDPKYNIVACYEINDMNREEFIKDVDKNTYKCNDIINKQEALEECITEAFNQIAKLITKKNKIFSEAVEDIIKNPNMRPDAVVGAKIINSLDEDTLKWFITTSYNDEYIDRFKIIFKDIYPKLLDIANRTYRTYLDSDFSKTNYNEIDNLDGLISTKKNDKNKQH